MDMRNPRLKIKILLESKPSEILNLSADIGRTACTPADAQRCDGSHPGVCEKNTPSDKKTGWKISFESTQSGAGLQFLLLGPMASA